MARSVESQPLRMVKAEDRAKRDIARELRVFVGGVFRDYQGAAFKPEPDTAETREQVEKTIEAIVEKALLGCEIAERWKDPKTDDYFVHARLNRGNLHEMLRQEIRKIEMNRLRMDAEDAHETLDKIIKKHTKNW